MKDTVEVEVEASDPAEAMDLAYERIKDRIELDEYYVAGIRPEDYDPDDYVYEYAYSIPRGLAKKCFEYIMPFWPESIDISDKKLLPGEGLFCSSLIEVNDSIEGVLELNEEAGKIPPNSESFFWALLSCVYGALLSKARQEGTKLYPGDLTFEEFERHFVQKHKGWKTSS